MCIRDRVGVQTLERADILGMPVGVGRSIVSKEQVERPGEAQMIDVFEKDDEGNYVGVVNICLLYTSDAADERSSVDLGGRRIIKKKKKNTLLKTEKK